MSPIRTGYGASRVRRRRFASNDPASVATGSIDRVERPAAVQDLVRCVIPLCMQGPRQLANPSSGVQQVWFWYHGGERPVARRSAPGRGTPSRSGIPSRMSRARESGGDLVLEPLISGIQCVRDRSMYSRAFQVRFA